MRPLVVLLAAILLAASSGACIFGDDDDTPSVRTNTPPRTTPTSAPTVSATAGTSPATTVTPTTTVPAGGQTYTVQSGDTLWDIAERFKTTVEKLVAANNLTDPDVLAIGDVLVIPPPEATTQ